MITTSEFHWIYEHLAGWEGFRHRAYRDVGGVWTIGYGHTAGVRRGQLISQPEALKLLEKDWEIHRDAVVGMLREAMEYTTQGQLIALTSIAFNIGPNALGQSHLMEHHRAGLHHLVPDDFRRWIYAGGRALEGLRKRREVEALQYAASTPSANGIQSVPV